MKKIVASIFLSVVSCSLAICQTVAPAIRYLAYFEAEPVITAMGGEVPNELATSRGENPQATWDLWVRRTDGEIRGRLEQGDEDSIVNLLLFGTSFTKQPRMTESQMNLLATNNAQNTAGLYETVLRERLNDFLLALSKPQTPERLRFAKSHLIKKLNIRIESADEKEEIRQFLIKSLKRVLNESSGFANIIEQARKNAEDIFVVRSKLFSHRGLSSDTSLKPNLAIEKAIAEIKQKGLVGKIRRVAIIGPGLDFTDKEEGYDFYPPQTLQPFAVIESLLKLNLADKASLRIDTFDLSPKVNSHIANFVTMAKLKRKYTVQLPLSAERRWSDEFNIYWKNFGSLIATPAKPQTLGNLPKVGLRAINIRTEFLSMIQAFDTNIVLQSPVLAEKDRYDLIIGTNIFVYYDSFEQGLAMLNLEKMMKDGAMLLSNNALIEFPFTPIHSIGYSKTIYSDRENDADAIVWYQKKR